MIFLIVDSTASSKIKLRIVGGKGKDTFNIRGHVRNVFTILNQIVIL